MFTGIKNMPDYEKTGLERHAQTVVQLVITALVMWVANTTNNTALEVAVLSDRMERMQIEIQKIQDMQVNRYTNDDAEKDFLTLEKELDRIKSRLLDLEKQ